MGNLAAILVLFFVGPIIVTIHGTWNGAEYWNARHSRHGISYDTADMFWGIWSDNPDILDHYFLEKQSYNKFRKQCTGCICDPLLRTVSGCRGNIHLQQQKFTRLTAESFADPSTIKSIIIIDVSEFVEFAKGSLDSLTALKELIVTMTGLRTFPDISSTAMTRMMLADNALFFSSVTPKISWPSSLKRLSLIQNKIVYIPDGFFTGSNLEYIALSRNQIKYVPGKPLAGVHSLKFLSVDDNHISGISRAHLSYLSTSQLKHLNLSNNMINYIEPYALAQLGQLLILELHNNMLSRLNKGVFTQIPNLVHLDLVKNQLTVLEEDSLVDLPALYTLRLHSQQQGNGLTTIYYNALKNINGNLTNLWLSDNALTSFPHGVLSEQQYDKLVNVQIDHNRIFNITLYSDQDFPPRTTDLHTKKQRTFELWKSTPNIATLNAGYNAIAGISPADLCGLQFLRDLTLTANTLLNDETFPDGTLDCLKRLYRIDLSYTSFTLVPKMTDMPTLRELRMNRCDLTVLEAGIFGDLQLTYISMEGNKIITIENNVFPSSVTYIVLQNNCFRFTHQNPFTNLRNLRYLGLADNKIDYIPDTAFHNCTSLITLLLHRNKISWLSNGMFKDSPLTNHFYAYENDISCIEDGTFNHTSRINYLYLHNNKLTKLPRGGDFSSKTIIHLLLHNNRFTEIPSRVFDDLYVTTIFTITGSSISTVRSGAFKNTRFGEVFDLRSNPLKTIEPGAFDSSTFDIMYMNGMQITHLPTGAFRSVTTNNLFLQSNDITHIEAAAFDDVHVDVGLFLQNNKLINLTNSVFVNASSISGVLDLSMNGITTVASEAFDGVSSISSIILNDNNIEEYPTAAFANSGIKHVNISNNNITELSLVAFRDQDLITLNMLGNRITKLRKGTLSTLASMTTLLLSKNRISYIEPGSFSGLTSIEEIDLADNDIFFFPAMPNLASLSEIDLGNNQLRTFEPAAFDELADSVAFSKLDLTGNQHIGCDCYMIETLKHIRDVISGGICGSPEKAVGIFLDPSSNITSINATHFLKADPSIFLCSPVNVTASTVISTDITVTWSRPDRITTVSETNPDAWRYQVNCSSSGGNVITTTIPSIQDSINTSLLNETNTTDYNASAINFTDTYSHIFTKDDGIQPDTEYICVITVLDGNDNFTSSPPSQPGIVRTQREKIVPLRNSDNSTNSTNPSYGTTTADVFDWVLPIIFYDFSQTHPDFVGYETAVTSKPTYVASPFGSWLKRSNNPSTDSFSFWFVDNPPTNMAVHSSITLKMIGTVPPTHRYESELFYPIDENGFGDIQKDCFGNDHNFGFTSAIRVGFVYQGIENETIAVGGGDDLWVFINGVLVLEVITRGNNFPCKMIDLSPASVPGGATITPKAGIMVSGHCIATTIESSESVFLDLKVGERYHLSIFHAERITCSSSLFIQTENFHFITDLLKDTPPPDYVINHPEDFHVNGTLQELYLADIFSVGPPFNITIIRGNDARHFTILDNTPVNKQAAAPPSVVSQNYTTVDGFSYIECPDPSSATSEGNYTSIETFVINTDVALFTLAIPFDYEATSLYTVVMEIVDPGKAPPSTGTITVKVNIQDVNDNCPAFIDTNIHINGEPALQIPPITTVTATDADSGTNSEVSYHISTVTEYPPLDFAPSLDLFDDIYTLTTNLSFSIIALDGGSPPRGSRTKLTFEVDNSCLIDAIYGPVNYSLTMDNNTGQLVFRAPGYYVFLRNPECDQALGMESGHIEEKDITASSFLYEGNPCRARLNFPGIPHTLGSIHGGWTPVEDVNQWIQVSLNTSYRINRLMLQGQADRDNWVTSVSITYSTDGFTWLNYTNETGNTVFEGNSDRDSIVTIVLDPEIITQLIRIHPITWHNHVGLRLELVGCSESQYKYDWTTCERCQTTNYCVGDGTSLPCGRCDPVQSNSTCGRSPTEYSFGLASDCTTCPLGWLCKDGYATPCPDFHYVNCTDSDCPSQCYPCEAGYACQNGLRIQCNEGTYSDGLAEYCRLCDPGTYQDEKCQSSCKPCPTGYASSNTRSSCDVCPRRAYLDLDTGSCLACESHVQCPCLAETSFCHTTSQCYNYQTGPGVYSQACLPCPPGFTGDGASCTDIDECDVYKPCWDTSSCINKSPGYQCKACPLGYTGTYEDGLTIDLHKRTFYWQNQVQSTVNQTCTDVDECLYNNGGCDVNAYCHNTIGSFYCTDCRHGYIGNLIVGCRLGDFCLSGENNCNINAECHYIGLGEFRCMCRTGWAGDGIYCGTDWDEDGVSDVTIPCSSRSCLADNCRFVANGGQEDNDGDRIGDVCDDDDDNDYICDTEDNCPFIANRIQTDVDGDGQGDECDNCINDVNYDQSDVDGDGLGDVCDDDIDGDSILNGFDNCPFKANVGQEDTDGDTVGDSCDNCISVPNPSQTDTYQTGVGDDCDEQDSDGDSVIDTLDNCIDFPNSVQTDTDNDGTGDSCDDDIDGDGVLNTADNCVYVANPGQEMFNGHMIRGDACERDIDFDGTPDLDDICPNDKNIANVTFSRYFTIDLNPDWTSESTPEWLIQNEGKDIQQIKRTLKPVALIGEQKFDHVTLTATTFVDSSEGYGTIGFILGYQSNRKYYLLTWRHNYFNLKDRGNVKGVQIWLVDSGTAPGTSYAYALYHGCDTPGITTLLWQDPDLIGWEPYQGYSWTIEHNPSIGLLRVRVTHGATIIVDSGNVFDVSIHGGRLGVFSYNQTGCHWSNLQYRCTERLNMALQFNGSTYGEIGTLSALSIESSFTLDVWIFVLAGYLSNKQPIICTKSDDVCLYVEGSTFHMKVGAKIIDGARVIMADTWTHLMAMYHAQYGRVTLFVDGSNGLSTQDKREYEIPALTWNTSDVLYLGRENDTYFNGIIDEVKIYNIAIPDADINTYWRKFDMTREYRKCILSAHYNMDNQTQSTILLDQGDRKLDVRLYGFPAFVQSTTDYHRFYDSIT